MINFIKDLNFFQRKVVFSYKENILVLAGAGSGKTRTIVYKIAWLIKKFKFDPNSIFVVTFTNKSANEIKSRINYLLKNNIKMNWIGTFHGLFYKILKLNYKYVNLNYNFQIIDKLDQIKILNSILKDNKINNTNKNLSINEILKFINYAKENNNFFYKFKNEKDNIVLFNIYENYKIICNNFNLIDFSELLLRSYNLFKNKKNILELYKNKFNMLLIDEFQDTNKIQYNLIKLLKSDKNYITAVGDDDQSIYQWRGSNINNTKKFINNFNAKTILLERNYRSTNNIVKVANSLISKNFNRSYKKLWTKKKCGDLVYIYEVKNEIEEINVIIKNLKLFYKLNNKTTFAILYRKNYQSRVVEEHLILNKLKYKIYGGLRFLERKEIKNSISYIKLIINRNDNLSLERIINFPSRKIGKKTLEIIKNISYEKNISYWNSILYILNNNYKKSIINNLRNFINLINNINTNIKVFPLPIQVSKIIKYSGLWNFYDNCDKNNSNFSLKIDNLIELINYSQKYYINYKNYNVNLLENFISYISIQEDSYLENDINYNIYLMTIHSSKGLEFDNVFIIGMEEGIFPSKEVINNINLLEEERRLAYVGITRAIERLVLIYSKKRLVNGKYVFNNKSRFINEISLKYVNFINI